MSGCIYQLINHCRLTGIWWMVASCVCLTCRMEFLMQTGNSALILKRWGNKRPEQAQRQRFKEEKSERQQQQRRRRQPLLPIWAVFGQPSRGHMAVRVKDLLWLLPYSPHLMAGTWETCYDKDSKHLSVSEKRRHIAEERWIGINCNI